ncbi:MAG: Sec-independent protein translocase subunit TatA/TatB [bacterium]|jgi:sec-independent protein translocase protein TatA
MAPVLAALWNIGPTEWIIILFLMMLVFGAKRLPEMGRSLGTGIKEFKKSLTSIDEEEDEPKKIETEKSTGTHKEV